MLSDINSKYIVAHIFDLIPFKLTLKIVAHNKNFQYKLDITLETYSHATGKYIEIINDYGKEYLLDDKILIFEGEYKSKKRDGKGKELYKNGKILFEGEYLNGKRWNGNIYNILGIKEFEITEGSGYINDYNINGIRIYSGYFAKGIKQGFGSEYFEGKIEYEGIFINGKRDIEGTEYYSSGKKEYEGDINLE